MPERGFATESWNSDEWFQELSINQRYLFIYLWANDHCNQAGLYHITLNTISDESLIPKDELPALLKSLEPKVIWYPEHNLVWVKNFIKRQSKSPKFLAAVAKSLLSISNNNAVNDLLQYNLQRHSISIPYQYYIDKISILTRVSDPHTNTSSNAKPNGGKGLGVIKGEGETKTASKRTFGELKNIKLTPEEYEKLVTKFGAQGANSWIEELSLAKASKGYKSKSDYATILAWDRREVKRKGGVSGDGRNKQHTQSHGEPYVWEEAPDEPDDTS